MRFRIEKIEFYKGYVGHRKHTGSTESIFATLATVTLCMTGQKSPAGPDVHITPLGGTLIMSRVCLADAQRLQIGQEITVATSVNLRGPFDEMDVAEHGICADMASGC